MRKKFYCLRYYVTHRCNSFCSFCDTHSPEYSGCSEMTPAEAETLLRAAHSLGCRYIDFTGGEPTLCQHLPGLLRLAKSLGIKTEVTTNGVQGMTETTRQCAMLADKFNVSLDSLSREIYESIRGVDGLESACEVIREASRIRQEAGLSCVKIMTVVTSRNLSSLDELLSFAVDNRAEIYFNPVFSYFSGCESPDCGKVIPVLERYIFRRNAVIMLHFLEFYKADGDDLPRCSACTQTLTIAPDGGLLVPCYHSRNKRKMLFPDGLQSLADSVTPDSQCKVCWVSPYFGISFSFRLDRFFLLASFSEKLVHLKRDYLNRFDLKPDEESLAVQLQELKTVINSLASSPEPEDGTLYYAEETPDGWRSPVYRETISSEQYMKDLAASDCWELERVPHREFDRMCLEIFPKAVKALEAQPEDSELREILSLAQEFTVRWWKYYVSVHFRTARVCSVSLEAAWLNEYFGRIQKRLQITIEAPAVSVK